MARIVAATVMSRVIIVIRMMCYGRRGTVEFDGFFLAQKVEVERSEKPSNRLSR